MARIASVAFVIDHRQQQTIQKVVVRITNFETTKEGRTAAPVEEIVLLDVENPGQTKEQRLYIDQIFVPSRREECPNGHISHYLTLESMTRLYVANLFDLEVEQVTISCLDVRTVVL